MTNKTDTKRAQGQAKSQLEGIVEMVKALENQEEIDGQDSQERIQEDPLSVEVRTSWHTLGRDTKPDEYMILLCTGGPACRIIGDLNEWQEPETAQIEYQDWFTPWEKCYDVTDEENKALLTYARQFYYGEG